MSSDMIFHADTVQIFGQLKGMRDGIYLPVSSLHEDINEAYSGRCKILNKDVTSNFNL